MREKNLMFFNKEGFPYNFEINDLGYYEGKLLFDENSNDTFKSLAIYVFEEVKPFTITDNFNVNKMEIYNYSGISFIPAQNSETIENIKKVNSASNFYSKWVYGADFDLKFPKGSIISFSGVTFNNSTTDFNNKYYTVLDNKPGAILVMTKTANSIWNLTFISGTINSHNIVDINDYDSTLYSDISSWTLHDDKKFSFIGTENNDGINNYVDDELMKTIYQTYDLTGNTGEELKINIELKSERAKIYQGQATFKLNGYTAEITFAKKFNSLFNITAGEQIIFEDYDDNPILASNPIFTIVDGTNEIDLYDGNVRFIKEQNINKSFSNHFNSKKLSSQTFVKNFTPTAVKNDFNTFKQYYPNNFFTYDYYLEITGSTILDLSVNDIIQLTATTSTGTLRPKNIMREFTVLELINFETIRLAYWKNRIISDPTWYNKVYEKSIIQRRLITEMIDIEAKSMYDQFDNNINSIKYINPTQRYERIKVKEYVIEENQLNTYNIKKLLTVDQIKTVNCTMSAPSLLIQTFTKNVVAYDTTNILSFTQSILGDSISPDYNKTIEAFNEKYGEYLYDFGILVYYTSGSSEKLNIHSLYPLNSVSNIITYDRYFNPYLYVNNIDLYGTGITNYQIDKVLLEFENDFYLERILPNDTNNFNKNFYLEILFDLSNNENNFGFNLTLNDTEYYINFTGDTQTTINEFILTYTVLLNNIGISLSASTNTLILSADYSNVDILSYSVKVNMYSTYEFITEIENKNLLISGNELELLSTDYTLFDYEFSTGMIFQLSGSSSINNKSYNIIGLTDKIIELSYQGILFDDLNKSLTLNIDSFLRKPRESVNKNVYYSLKFDEPFSEDIFFYDFSGEHLKPYLNDERLRYIGQTPLWDISQCSIQQLPLNDEPNKNINYISDSNKQQTQFKGKDGDYCLNFLLDTYSSNDNFNYVPEPLQIFLGFNSDDEGISQTTIYMDKIENIIFSGYTTTDLNFSLSNSGLLYLTTNQNNFNFIDYGFEKNQSVTIDFIDQSDTGTTIFQNYGIFSIEYVGGKQIKLYQNIRNSIDEDFDFVEFNTSSNTNGYYYEIKVAPTHILKLSVYGETEIEDERFRIALNNLGVQLNEEVEHIFKESDINEEGIDYIRLNQKRKEMLLMHTEIYNYIGSYKALINAINFFGWNDLRLFEYYKNINPASPLYNKLHKIEINDIFDNTIDGYTTTDYISGKYKTGLVKKTNLFNLTYNITDENGNNVLLYSLDEVQIKLQKLKRWLKRNILPLSTNIIDITGVAYVDSINYQYFDSSPVSIKGTYEDSTTAINFVITETLNFQTNYLVELEFYTRNNFIPSGWTCKVQTFSQDENNKLIPQNYFKLMKNNLGNFSFNIDKNIDKYLYVETNWYNDFGLGQTYNKMTNTSTSKNYLLINNRFHIPDYNYLNIDKCYYWFDDEGYIFIND